MKNTVDNTRDIKVLISQLSAFIKTISEILNNSNTAETARYASYADMAWQEYIMIWLIEQKIY